MTMQRFDYLETEHLDEVISTLVEYGSDATLLAGGTDLLNMIRTGTVKPRIVINLKHVSSLSGINDSNGELRLRALTKIKALNRRGFQQARIDPNPTPCDCRG
jgi:carbon-monoxide dehydrogenase medium subunit